MKRSAAAGSGARAGDGKSFEEMMQRLEELVEKLEGGNLTLEESIRSFEEGMTLVKSCSTVLQEADLRIQKLTEETDKAGSVVESGKAKRDADDVEGELPF